MKDFEFTFPTRVFFGRGVQKRVGELAQPYGKRAMLLYGSERIRRSGLYEELVECLAACKVSAIPLGGITENPTLSKAQEACQLAKEEKVDLLLAVGGGSVIDTAKAVSIGACHNSPLWDFYRQRSKAMRALPIGVVLTTAATASEANCVSVLCNEEENRKCALNEPLTYPAFALMNPELTYTVPPYQTAAGAVDLFSHSFERYFHKEQWGTLRAQLCEGTMRTVICELPRALAAPDDYDARSQLMWAATVAHSDILGKEGDYACHALSHVLTGRFGLSHGVALGILMPAWCRFMLEKEPDAIAHFFSQVWQVPSEQSKALTAQNGIAAFQGFIRRVGLPATLWEAGFPDASPQALAEKALADSNGFLGGNFHRLYHADVVRVLELAKGDSY